jgi:hypothetical protein
VRPVSYGGAVSVTAAGPGRVAVRARGRHGLYGARLVFPAAGRWSLAVRAGGSTWRLGSVQVRPAPAQPVPFIEPTSIDLEPSGTLLLVENNPGRVLRVDPGSGRVTVLVASLDHPYAVARSQSGAVFLSVGDSLSTIDSGGTLTTLVTAPGQIGPIAVASNGDVYYATQTQAFRLAAGGGPAVQVAGQLGGPHGLAVAADGALLISDTDNDRILRVDPSTGKATALAQVGSPRRIDVAADGSIYVADSIAGRVLHLAAGGARIGYLGPAFQIPYDVVSAGHGAVYLLESGSTRWIRRIAADGTVTTVSRR